MELSGNLSVSILPTLLIWLKSIVLKVYELKYMNIRLRTFSATFGLCRPLQSKCIRNVIVKFTSPYFKIMIILTAFKASDVLVPKYIDLRASVGNFPDLSRLIYLVNLA